MPRQFSPHPDHPAVGFLLRLHADLAGKVQQNKIEAEQLQEGVRHVEAVIKMFAPEFNLRQIAHGDGTNPTEQEEVDLRAAIRASLEHNAGKTVQRVGDGIPRRWALRHQVAR